MYYSFGKPKAGDCTAIEQNDGTWTIAYYSERGDRRIEGTYVQESDACSALFAIVKTVVEQEQHRSITF